jgi:hypothetical protein
MDRSDARGTTDAPSGWHHNPSAWSHRRWVIGLAVAQPLLVHAWCTLCLCSAAISLTLVGPAIDEAQASLQFMDQVGADGGSRWRAFWGLTPDANRDRRSAPSEVAG